MSKNSQEFQTVDVVKEAVDYSRTTLHRNGFDVGPAHLHQAVAGYLGYQSKVALNADYFSSDDPNIILSIEPNIQQMTDNISRQKESPLKQVAPCLMAGIIRTGLTPACACCGEKNPHMTPVADAEHASLDGYDPVEWVCPKCSTNEEYGHCHYCGDELRYRLSDLNENGECSIHAGESSMDPEEVEDWESYVENRMNNAD